MNIQSFFREQAEKVSFIELKEGSNVKIKDYEIKSNMPLPIMVENLVTEIKEKRAEEALNLMHVLEGMAFMIGVDSDFSYCNEYERILRAYEPEVCNYMMYKAHEAAEKQNFDLALVFLKAAYNLEPDNLKVMYNYAFALEEKAKKLISSRSMKNSNVFLDESIKIFESTLNLDDKFAPAHYKLGYHYINKKQFIKAQVTWKKFLKLTTDSDAKNEIEENLKKMQDDVDYEMGYDMVLNGRAQEGLDKLEPLKEKYDDWWNLIFMIGLAKRQLNQFESAIEEFERVLEINPAQSESKNELGLCLAYLGKSEEAIEKFTELIEEKEDPEVLCNRGMTYYQLNKLKEAKNDIYRAYEINPDDEVTLACKSEIDRAI